MRKILSLTAAAAALIATSSPAFAGDTRVDLHYGLISSQGSSSDVGGIAVGHDVDTSFGLAGAEVSADKIFDSGVRTAFGFTARAGLKVAGEDRVFAAAGYTTKFCGSCDGSVNLGVGYERQFGNGIYAKAEYRGYLTPDNVADSNNMAVGIGFRF